MPGSLRYHKSLARPQFHRPVFEIDQKPPLDHVEKFILYFMLMPMIFAFNHTYPYHRIVHGTQRFVVPLIRAVIGESFDIDQFERPLACLQACFVGIS